MTLPTAPIAAGSLVGGYLLARETRKRSLGGLVLAAAGVYLARRWRRERGSTTAAVLAGTYVAGFAGSHPLAKRIGAWPAVLTVAALSAAASHVLADGQTRAVRDL
jgi:hypothetical protein